LDAVLEERELILEGLEAMDENHLFLVDAFSLSNVVSNIKKFRRLA
jgi:hypothetical protein